MQMLVMHTTFGTLAVAALIRISVLQFLLLGDIALQLQQLLHTSAANVGTKPIKTQAAYLDTSDYHTIRQLQALLPMC